VIVFETERMILRRLTLADAAFVVRLVNDPAWLRYIGDRGIKSEEDARAYLLKGPLDSYARSGFGLWAMTRKEDGTVIGICGLLKRDFLEDVDLGFALLPEWRGQGLAREAAAATFAHARTTLGLARVVAITSPENTRSGALLESIGFRLERRMAHPPDGTDMLLYASGA